MQEYKYNSAGEHDEGEDFQIDGSGHSPENKRTPLPPNEYRFQFESFTNKPTKAGTGRYIEVCMSVVEGQHEGRLCWDVFNYENPSAAAVDIGIGEMRQFLTAVARDPNAGISISGDVFRSLLGQEFVAKIRIDPDRPEANDVVEYFTIDGHRVMESGFQPRGSSAHPSPPMPPVPPVASAPVPEPVAAPPLQTPPTPAAPVAQPTQPGLADNQPWKAGQG
jgi:hypothetical protein